MKKLFWAAVSFSFLIGMLIGMGIAEIEEQPVLWFIAGGTVVSIISVGTLHGMLWVMERLGILAD